MHTNLINYRARLWMVAVNEALGQLFPAREDPPAEILRHTYFDTIGGEIVSRENA
jgi:hypothetical protein